MNKLLLETKYKGKFHKPLLKLKDERVVIGCEVDEHNRLQYVIQAGEAIELIPATSVKPKEVYLSLKGRKVTILNK